MRESLINRRVAGLGLCWWTRVESRITEGQTPIGRCVGNEPSSANSKTHPVPKRPLDAREGDSNSPRAGSRPARDGFRPDIEGLRAVAVFAVVLFHGGVPGVGGGFIGVDVFFVISGFLITGLLWREVSTAGTVGLRRFYRARARRLLPASSCASTPRFHVRFGVKGAGAASCEDSSGAPSS